MKEFFVESLFLLHIMSNKNLFLLCNELTPPKEKKCCRWKKYTTQKKDFHCLFDSLTQNMTKKLIINSNI